MDLGKWKLVIGQTVNHLEVGDTGEVSLVAPFSYGHHKISTSLMLKGSEAEIGEGSHVSFRVTTPKWYREIVLGPRPNEV